MIEAFMDGAIIIDNNKEQVEDLCTMLENKDIWTKYYHPSEFESGSKKLPNKKIIFLDLHLKDGEDKLKGHISYSIHNIFMKAIGESYNPYGIVLWSGHTKEKEEDQTQLEIFKDSIGKAISSGMFSFRAPLFIVGLDKNDYNRAGSFEAIFTDLENELKTNTAAKFFINWSNAINEGKNKSIHSIYSLLRDYNLQDENLRFLLYHLAKNQTGIHHDELEDYPLHADAYSAFSNLLMYEISSSINMSTCGLFNDLSDLQYSKIDDSRVLVKNYANEYSIAGEKKKDPIALKKDIDDFTAKTKMLKEYEREIQVEINQQKDDLSQARKALSAETQAKINDFNEQIKNISKTLPSDEISQQTNHLSQARDALISETQVKTVEFNEQIEILNDYFAKFKAEINSKITYVTQNKTSLTSELQELKKLDDEINSHFATINTKLLLDENVEHSNIMPGNIYIIKKAESEFFSKLKNPIDMPIIIEMTPPCDFANGKKGHPKLLGGFITKHSNGRILQLRSDAIYIESQPLKLAGYEDNVILCFDFRYLGMIPAVDLNDSTQYELVYRAKESLFSDILQKLSSHTARLGLAVLH